jgi:ATP-dependent protease ClpP protease subunit
MKRKLTSVLVALSILLTGCVLTIGEKEDTVFKTLDNGAIIFPASQDPGAIGKYMEALQEDRDYHIIIDSFGGSAFDLLGIMNRIQELQRAGFHITTESYGYACSAGAYIFLTGDTRIAHTGALFMLHGGGVPGSYGARRDLRDPDLAPELQSLLKIIDGEFIRLLLEKTHLTEKEVDRWLYTDESNWMSSEEAFELNIATELR